MSLNSVILRQKLQLTLDSYVFGSSEIDDVVALALAAAVTDNINIMTVVDTGDLPILELYDTASPVLCFVLSVNIFAISSNKKWLTLDGRLLRDDTGRMPTVLLAWGFNYSGQLGDNSTITSRSSPVSVIGGFTDWCQVSNSSQHTAAVRTNGTLWAWGYNNVGQLGDNTIINKSSPVSVVGGFTDWCQVSANRCHTAAVRTNGTLWAWGCNGSGRLGDNTATSRSSPVLVVGGFTDWCQVAAGGCHTAALRTNGTLWAWGVGFSGRLGDGTITSRSSPVSVIGGFTDWCQVSAGERHTAAVRTNGTLWAWGENGNGQAGDGTTTCKTSPVSVIGGFTDWCQVSAADFHTAALRTNGTLWTWGFNIHGRLGDGTITARSSPVSVIGGFTNWCQVAAGTAHTAAVRTNGTLWAWGYNLNGRLGDNTATDRSSPVSVIGGFTDWCQVSAGRHTAAVRTLC
jgi:alpha-tubulin suppressor-like RCC1 family protein